VLTPCESALVTALENLLQCPDLNLDSLEPATRKAIRSANKVLTLAENKRLVLEQLSTP
jgi:hypothetical protein